MARVGMCAGRELERNVSVPGRGVISGAIPGGFPVDGGSGAEVATAAGD
jgi:hypothetical protein